MDDVAAVELVVDAPPPVPRTSAGTATRLVPVVTALAAVAMLVIALRPGSAAVPGLRSPMLMVFPLMLAASAAVGIAGGGGRARAELSADRGRYLRYLAELSVRLADDAAAQRSRLLDRHPDPAALWQAADRADRCGIRAGTPDFCLARAGLGAVPAATRVIAPAQDRCAERDPVTATALTRLEGAYRWVADAPVLVAVSGATVTIGGDVERARALARAIVAQLALSHHPGAVAFEAHTGDDARRHWDWLKWLPHHVVSPTADGRRIVVVDGTEPPDPQPSTTALRIVDDGAGAALRLRSDAGELAVARPDQMTTVAAEALARRLAARRGARAASGAGGWLSRIGIDDPRRVDPQRLWHNGSGANLVVPLGTGGDGGSVDLDIGEAAAGGMGPHGLCLGATGSGKSELLRTIALGMIARHSPETLNLILVDFKGGATFLDLGRARHTTAVITNLEDEAHLVERMRDALDGEIDRRQRILRAAGNLTGVAEYHRARRAGRSLERLPALFIVVDEFSELLHRHPEFVDVFVAIGRLGRSLGMHLLLASQRLEEGRLRGLDSHLSYRICLKTLSDSESRMAIGVPDAYHLPNRPGAAYLKVAAGEPIRFQAHHVSGPLPVAPTAPPRPALFTADAAAPETADTEGPGLLHAVVEAVAGHGPRPHQVWLPPLAQSPTLGGLPGAPGDGLQLRIGLVDRAFEHRRDPLEVDLSGAAGNVAIVGAPRSGKTTALRTVVTALAAANDARRVQLYCLDSGGGQLADLATLPQVGAVAAGADAAALGSRILAEISGLLRRREAGRRDDPYGEVFLVIDGWATARRDHDDLEATVTAIAADGLGHRIHVVLTASRWAELRPALRDQIGTRIELRLGDPADSEIDRARAARVPRDRPGHGLAPDGSPMVIARPGDATRAARHRPDGWRAPAVRLLPHRADHADVLAAAPAVGCVLGIGEEALEPVLLDFADGHLLVFGEPGSGKTAVLRLLCREIARTAPAARLVALDPRGTLAEFGGQGLRRLPELLRAVRERDTAATLFVVIDDYDLAATAVAPLAEDLLGARDTGLHMVVARRSGGAARALYDPVLSALRETGAMGLQLSGSPDDGPLIGSVRPGPLPPGRGVLVTRAAGARTVQVAWAEPA